MLTQREGIALADDDAVVLKGGAEETDHHIKGLGGGNHGGIGIGLHKVCNIGGMVHLHMLDHQVIRLTTGQDILDIVQPLMGEAGIHGIHNGDLLVQDHIRIVGHAVGHHILALEQIHLVVVNANIFNIIGNKHKRILLHLFCRVPPP